MRTGSLARLISALLSIVLLAACAAAPTPPAPATPAAAAKSYPPAIPADKQVTILFENYNLASAGLGRDATLEMIDAFQKAHPNIKVETKATDSTKIMASVQAGLAAGSPPDLAQMLLREWDVAVENLAARPLDDIVPPEELKAHLAGMHPKAVKLGERGGKLYGLPYVFSTPTLFYNADIFKAAGLDPERPPRTWADVKAQALQIKEKTGKSGVYIACVYNDWCAQAVLLSNGGRIMTEDRSKVTFADPAAVEALKMWQELVALGLHPKLSESEGQELFQAGNMAMYINTSAVQSSLLKSSEGKWTLKAAGLPGFGDKPPVPTNSGSGLSIHTTDPIKQRAAWELMKFLTSEYAYTIITTKIGYLPIRPSIVTDEKYLKGWITTHPQILPNLEQLANLEPSVTYPGANQVQIRDIYLKAQQQVLYNGADPDATMREAQARATDLMPKR
jgi:multiple sugar transport system substrate-binding protein